MWHWPFSSENVNGENHHQLIGGTSSCSHRHIGAHACEAYAKSLELEQQKKAERHATLQAALQGGSAKQPDTAAGLGADKRMFF